MKKKLIKLLLCATLMCTTVSTGMPGIVYAAGSEKADDGSSGDGGNSDGGLSSIATGDMEAGADKDLIINNYSVKGNEAGGKITVSFTVSANSDTGSLYDVSSIKRVYPVIDDASPFETNDEAYRITTVNAKSASISYTFTAKDNLDTGYFPVNFIFAYTRTLKKDQKQITSEEAINSFNSKEYFITRGYSVKINGKEKKDKDDNAEVTSADGDVSISVKATPSGSYGGRCKVAFTASSSSYLIKSVTPVIGENFPFETKGDAYKCVETKGVKKLGCSYSFTVRSDITTGYHPVSFSITYMKDNKLVSATKTINANLTGKKAKEESSGTGDAKVTSTPRLMVTGCDTSLEAIYPNDVFTLTVHLKNNAKKTVSNIKVTLVNGEEKSFISTSGASSAFVDSIPAGGSADVSFDLQADSSLTAKAYGLTVKTEYEDAKGNPFSSEDGLTIPVTLKSEFSLADIQPPYDLYEGGMADLNFTINNTGAAAMKNVKVNCSGDDISAEETYVGNIAAGESGYATISLTGTQVTQGEGKVTVTVSYEDASGKEQTYSEDVEVYVMEMMVEDDSLYEEVPEDEGSSNALLRIIIIAVIIIAVVVVVVIIVMRNKKKRKLAEEELMEDDI